MSGFARPEHELAKPVVGSLNVAASPVGGQGLALDDVGRVPPDAANGAAYTPALTAAGTALTLGTGSMQSGRFLRVGKLVFCYGVVQFGSSGTAAGTGNYRVSLPVSAAVPISSARFGTALLFDNSTGVAANAFCGFDGANTDYFVLSYPDGAPTGALTSVSATTPWAWAASDLIRWFITYETA